MENPYLVADLSPNSVFLTPTDTVWGIGADATIVANYQRIREIKQRPSTTHFVLLMKDISMVEKYFGKLTNKQIQVLTESNTPTTLLIPYQVTFPEECKPKDSDFIAIRIPKHPLCLQIIEQLDNPIISTSANLHKQNTPTQFEDIPPEIKNQVDCILGKKHPIQGTGKSSMIVKLSPTNQIEYLRK